MILALTIYKYLLLYVNMYASRYRISTYTQDINGRYMYVVVLSLFRYLVGADLRKMPRCCCVPTSIREIRDHEYDYAGPHSLYKSKESRKLANLLSTCIGSTSSNSIPTYLPTTAIIQSRACPFQYGPASRFPSINFSFRQHCLASPQAALHSINLVLPNPLSICFPLSTELVPSLSVCST